MPSLVLRSRALADPVWDDARSELSSNIRSLAVGRYVVFYLPLSRGIEVVRVLHGSRDIESIFKNEE